MKRASSPRPASAARRRLVVVDEAPRPRVETVLEPIEVAPGDFDAASMGRGEPGVPRRFTWRGEVFEIVRVLERAREVGPCRSGGGEVYVRRHATRALTRGGAIVTLSAERRTGAGPRWILRSVERP
jgi:hypothetical protein